MAEFKEDSHEELAVVDKTGRVQIPEEYLKALGLKGANKIKIELHQDSVKLYSPHKVFWASENK